MIGTKWLTVVFPGSKKLVRVVVTGFREHPRRPIQVRLADTTSAHWYVAPQDLLPLDVA